MTKAKASGSSSDRTTSGKNKGLGLKADMTEKENTQENSAKESATKPSRVKLKVSNQNASDSDKNAQVLALLNVIGDRLIRSEKERNELKDTVQDIGTTLRDMDGRTDNAEKAYLTLQTKMQQTEQTAIEIQDLFAIQQQQAGKIAKAVAFADKLDQALKHQERMNKRLDRFAEDRLKLDKKLSKIEKTVTLTQKSIQSGSLMPLDLTDDMSEGTKPKGSIFTWAGSRAAAQAITLTLIVATIITTGFILKEKDLSYLFSISRDDTVAYVEAEAAFDEYAADQNTAVQLERNQLPSVPDAAPIQAIKAPAVAKEIESATLEQVIDITNVDTALLSEAFDQNPQEVAKVLNKIEPVSAAPQAAIAATEEVKPSGAVKPATAMKTTAVNIPAAAPAKIEAETPFNVDAFLKSQTSKQTLEARLRRDSTLPEMAKTIEDKAFNGVPTAQHDLGVIYSAGHGNIAVNFEKAYAWFKESALQGVANARYNLGVLHHQGLGVDKDMNMALNWYRAAAALNHPDAQYNLGIAHIEGVGTKYSPKEATKFFTKAAEAGVMEAAYNLGLIYENGLLGSPQAQDAIYWYSEAVAQDSVEAQTALKQLGARLNMTDAQIKAIYAEKKRLKSEQAPDKRAFVQTPPKAKKLAAKKQPPAKQAKPVKTAQKKDVVKQERAAKKSQSLIMKLQQQLYNKDLYPGPINGQMTDRLTDAIIAYQKSRDLTANGQASNTLLIHIMADDLGEDRITDVGSRAE